MIFRLTNAKAIEDGIYEFPDVGIVQFKGPNSNGKSILLHVLSDILKMDITSQEARDPLIRDNYEEMSLQIEYKGKALLVFINRDKDLCKLAYRRPGEEELIIRFLREGGWQEIFEEFGFIVYKDSFVLQIFETFGKMPFVNMSPKETCDLVDLITRDPVAEQFLANYRTVTHPKFQSAHKTAKESVASVEAQLGTLTNIDYISYETLQHRLEAIYPYVRYLQQIRLTELIMPPKVTIWPVPKVTLPFIPLPSIIPVMDTIPDISEQIRQYSEIISGVCPTCGKQLVGEHEIHVKEGVV